jgi:hypothetical protein
VEPHQSWLLAVVPDLWMLCFSQMSSMAHIFVARRFCGPPDSGNGGYSSGLVANALKATAECTLRKPIPIERELAIEERNSSLVLINGGDVIIECKPTEIDMEVRPSLTLQQAQEAAEHSPAFDNHPFPTCFTCGPLRTAGDGLRIFPGRLETDSDVFAAPWLPDSSLADGNGRVKPEFVWAAMDCPTGFAGGFPWAGKLVTGRLAVQHLAPVKAGEPHVVVSWPLGWEGRKSYAAAALYNTAGELCATAKATWIKVE